MTTDVHGSIEEHAGVNVDNGQCAPEAVFLAGLWVGDAVVGVVYVNGRRDKARRHVKRDANPWPKVCSLTGWLVGLKAAAIAEVNER